MAATVGDVMDDVTCKCSKGEPANYYDYSVYYIFPARGLESFDGLVL
jgi:hypothetical protein